MGKKDEGAATCILGDTVSGERYAILIRISDYPGVANDLEYADDDALVMKDALVNTYGFSAGDIICLLDADATAEAIFSAISDIGQIATSNGKLSVVTEIGAEGFDVAAGDYWDCILTTSDGDCLVNISFSLQLPHSSARDNPVEWSEGATPPTKIPAWMACSVCTLLQNIFSIGGKIEE